MIVVRVIGAAVELGLPLASMLAAAKRVKYGAAASPALSRVDASAIGLLALGWAVVVELGPALAGWAVVIGVVGLCLALLLDVIMYRVFTIELRPDGLSGVIFSEL